MSDSVILIPVPQADPIVDTWRKKYDEVSNHGIPSHITLLFPFQDSNKINQQVISKLYDLFTKTSSFSFKLSNINTFPGVVYLEPSSKDKFIELTKEIVKIFPENPPYGGKFPMINPHLTIGQLEDVNKTDLIKREVLHNIKQKIPITACAEEVWLMIEDRGEWLIKSKFKLLN